MALEFFPKALSGFTPRRRRRTAPLTSSGPKNCLLPGESAVPAVPGGSCALRVDLAELASHIRDMDFDISHLLKAWEYKAGDVMVRRFRGRDGQEKLQLRVDLGLLQMNLEGRPDGKKPHGHISLFEYHQARLYKHVAAHNGSDEGFKLDAEQCSELQVEALQYHHRYICLLQLEDFSGVIRDAERNLALFKFVDDHAEEELGWALRQFRPQLLLVLTRARGLQALKSDDYALAIQHVEEGLELLRESVRERSAGIGAETPAESSPECASLEEWLEEIRSHRPLSRRERLEKALHDAVRREDYERAARVRDELKTLKAE